MTRYDEDYYQYEKSYGDFAVGSILSGLVGIVVGLFQFAAWAWRRK